MRDILTKHWNNNSELHFCWPHTTSDCLAHPLQCFYKWSCCWNSLSVLRDFQPQSQCLDPLKKKCTYHHLKYIGPYCKIHCPEIVLWQRNNFFILNTGHNGKKEHSCNCMYSKKFKKYEKLDKVILLHKSNCNKNICKYKYNLYFIMIMKFTIILFLYSTALLPYIM